MSRTRAMDLKGYGKKKRQIYDKLGRKCVRCGFEDERALQIDHILGNGALERKRQGKDYFRNMYEQIVWHGSKDYQILCANCNWIKRSENKEYKKQNKRATPKTYRLRNGVKTSIWFDHNGVPVS